MKAEYDVSVYHLLSNDLDTRSFLIDMVYRLKLRVTGSVAKL